MSETTARNNKQRLFTLIIPKSSEKSILMVRVVDELVVAVGSTGLLVEKHKKIEETEEDLM